MLQVKAFAKINLCLEILGKRSDGYHEVKTVLQTINLADKISIKTSSQLKIECTDPKLSGNKNLVWRAIEALGKFTGKAIRVEILIRKHIPVGMGLGGGSSDAATILKTVNEICELFLDDDALHSIGSSLGADVPFFLRGGTCLGNGIGDKITPLKDLKGLWVVLLIPKTQETYAELAAGGKTSRMYSMIRPANYTDGSLTVRLIDSLGKGQEIRPYQFNAFETTLFSTFPDLETQRSLFLSAGAKNVHVSGSGPSLFTLVDSYGNARNIAQNLKNIGVRSYCLRTIPSDGIKTRS